MRFLFSLFAMAVVWLVHADGAAGSGASAISLSFNTSPRAEGMGGAGVATVWGGDTNLWANPALLAFRPGVRYGTMHSQLAKGLTDDIFIDKKELTLNHAGLGLLYARAPMDHVFLNMGTQQGTDENGNATGEFQSWMRSRSWGLGVGVAQVLEHFDFADLNGWFDVAGGVIWRDFEDRLAPDDVLQDATTGGVATASATTRPPCPRRGDSRTSTGMAGRSGLMPWPFATATDGTDLVPVGSSSTESLFPAPVNGKSGPAEHRHRAAERRQTHAQQDQEFAGEVGDAGAAKQDATYDVHEEAHRIQPGQGSRPSGHVLHGEKEAAQQNRKDQKEPDSEHRLLLRIGNR